MAVWQCGSGAQINILRKGYEGHEANHSAVLYSTLVFRRTLEQSIFFVHNRTPTPPTYLFIFSFLNIFTTIPAYQPSNTVNTSSSITAHNLTTLATKGLFIQVRPTSFILTSLSLK